MSGHSSSPRPHNEDEDVNDIGGLEENDSDVLHSYVYHSGNMISLGNQDGHSERESEKDGAEHERNGRESGRKDGQGKGGDESGGEREEFEGKIGCANGGDERRGLKHEGRGGSHHNVTGRGGSEGDEGVNESKKREWSGDERQSARTGSAKRPKYNASREHGHSGDGWVQERSHESQRGNKTPTSPLRHDKPGTHTTHKGHSGGPAVRSSGSKIPPLKLITQRRVMTTPTKYPSKQIIVEPDDEADTDGDVDSYDSPPQPQRYVPSRRMETPIIKHHTHETRKVEEGNDTQHHTGNREWNRTQAPDEIHKLAELTIAPRSVLAAAPLGDSSGVGEIGLGDLEGWNEDLEAQDLDRAIRESLETHKKEKESRGTDGEGDENPPGYDSLAADGDEAMQEAIRLSLEAPMAVDVPFVEPIRDLEGLIDHLPPARKSEGQVKLDLLRTQYGFISYRPVRGDGNCYYRAVIYAWLEQALLQPSPNHLFMLMSLLENTGRVVASWPDPTRRTEFIHEWERSLEPVHRLLNDCLQQLDWPLSPEALHDWLRRLERQVADTTDPLDNALVFVARMVTAAHVITHQSSDTYAPVLAAEEEGDISNFCVREMLTMGREAGDLSLLVAAEALSACISIVVCPWEPQQPISQQIYGDQHSTIRMCLLFRPGTLKVVGHYDILYTDTTLAPQPQVQDRTGDQMPNDPHTASLASSPSIPDLPPLEGGHISPIMSPQPTPPSSNQNEDQHADADIASIPLLPLPPQIGTSDFVSSYLNMQTLLQDFQVLNQQLQADLERGREETRALRERLGEEEVRRKREEREKEESMQKSVEREGGLVMELEGLRAEREKEMTGRVSAEEQVRVLLARIEESDQMRGEAERRHALLVENIAGVVTKYGNGHVVQLGQSGQSGWAEDAGRVDSSESNDGCVEIEPVIDLLDKMGKSVEEWKKKAEGWEEKAKEMERERDEAIKREEEAREQCLQLQSELAREENGGAEWEKEKEELNKKMKGMEVEQQRHRDMIGKYTRTIERYRMRHGDL